MGDQNPFPSFSFEVTQSNPSDSTAKPQPLFPIARPKSQGLVTSQEGSLSMPSFSSFNMAPPPPAPEPAAVASAPIMPLEGRRPKASDFFKLDTEKKIESTQVVPSDKQPPREFDDFLDESDSSSSSSESDDGKGGHKKHKKKKRKADKQKSHKKSSKRTKSAEDKVKQLQLNIKHIKSDPRRASDLWLVPSREIKPYFEDFRGDVNNAQFGLFRQDIPNFHRLSKYCLGLDARFRVFWEQNSQSFILTDLRYAADPLMSSASNRFFYASKKELRDRERDTVHIMPVKGGIDPFATLQGVVHIDVTGLDTASQQQETLEAYLGRRTREFNERTRNERNNTKLWIEFANFQDEYIRLGKSRALGPILEKKIEIYRRAIDMNPQSDELLLGMLACCEQLYDTEKMQQIWNQTIANHPDSAALWKAFLMFVQSNFSSFTIQQFRNVYTTALKALHRQKRMYTSGIAKHRLLEERALAIALRAAHVEKQAGYVERATALLQALVEFTCFMPDKFAAEKNKDLVLTFFQAFWDAEVPRFGEHGAKGWKEWQLAAESTVQDAIELVQDYDPSAPTIDDDEEKELQLRELQRMVQANEENATRAAESNKKSSRLAQLHGGVTDKRLIDNYEGDENEDGADDARSDMDIEIEEKVDGSVKPLASDRADEVNGDEEYIGPQPLPHPTPSSHAPAQQAPERPQSSPSDETNSNQAEVAGHIDELVKWLQNEDLSDIDVWMPLHASDEEEFQDDPERVVLFEDIRDFLFPLSYPELRMTLVTRVMDLVGTRWPASRSSSSRERIEKIETELEDFGDAFAILDELEYPPMYSQGNLSDSTVPVAAPASDLSYDERLRRIMRQYTTLLDKSALVSPLVNGKGRQEFIKNALEQASVAFKLDQAQLTEMTVMRLQLEPIVADIKAGRTLAKTFLKVNSTSVKLWDAYARMERVSGNINDARKVYDMALAMGSKFPVGEKPLLPILVRSFAEMELYDHPSGVPGSDQVVMTILLALVEEQYSPIFTTASKKPSTTVAGTRILKAHKAFEHKLETLLEAFRAAASSKSAHPLAKLQPNTAATTKLQPDAFRDFIICYSLFERLSGSQADSLSRAVAVYDQGLQALKLHPEHNGFYEHLLVSKVAMMFSESSKKAKGISPGALKAVLEGGLREFPSNVFLMSVYLISESKAQLTGSLRLFFDEQLEATDRKASSLVWMFAIRAETRQGSGNRIKGLFERALRSDESTRQSPALWKFYIDFELSQGRLQEAKGVFFRAIRNVPWNKSVWMYSIRRFIHHLSADELADVFSLMTDKEIRLRGNPPL